MDECRYDVVGIGNAIVDIIARCDDAKLDRLGLPKGYMRLIGEDDVVSLYKEMGPAVEVSGGSAANTMTGIASLGGKSAFVGKVSDDEFGRIFRHDIRAADVSFEVPLAENDAPTARSLIFVTPDGERTMNTFLGVSPLLNNGEIDPTLIAQSKITYLEGYLFDRDEAKQAFHQAARIAREAGRKVSLSLSDSFCVDRHRQEFLNLIRERVDLLFANEEEICALYGTKDFATACDRVAEDADLAAVTRGAAGCVVITRGEKIEVSPDPVEEVVDTTGAGDLYAAGFLQGLARDLDLRTCARLAGVAAAEIISHIGARPENRLIRVAREKGLPV